MIAYLYIYDLLFVDYAYIYYDEDRENQKRLEVAWTRQVENVLNFNDDCQ